MPFTFEELGLPGLVLIHPRVFEDERGFFLETYRASDFEAAGINDRFVQANTSYSTRNVLRGLHFQAPPLAQAKLVRIIKGEIYDVVVDIDRTSASFGQWRAVHLTAESRDMLYIPASYAHGFSVVNDAAQVCYDVTAEFSAPHERGIIWNDPSLAIPWPVEEPIVSPRDAAWPGLDAIEL